MIERLRAGGVRFSAAGGPELPQTLVGKSVVVTGTLSGFSREEAEAAIIGRGGSRRARCPRRRRQSSSGTVPVRPS